MVKWRLPLGLTSLIQPATSALSARARNVELATRIARHSTQGWSNAAIPDDLHDVADFLQIGIEPARHLLMEIDE